MPHRSPGGTAEAPVRPGRAPRRAPARALRALLVAALSVLATLTLAPAAHAHGGGDEEVTAVLDRITPDLPAELDLQVLTTRLGPQFVVENRTQTEITILSSVGDPLFRIGPEGVLGNFRSPEWYTSKAPGGEAATVPDRAADRGTPVWARVSREPAWGWFDHRLHAATLTPEQKAAMAPLTSFGTWTVPIQFGDQLGSVDGHFEFRPEFGRFIPELDTTSPAPGVTLTAVPGNPVPGLSVSNEGASEVVVLGDQEEPYLRLTAAGVDANLRSPTHIKGQDPALANVGAGDPTATPEWVQVNGGRSYTFVLERAGPDQDLASLYAVDEPTVMREWTVSLLVDGQRIDIPGRTTLTPLGYEPSSWPMILMIGGIVLGVAALVAAGWYLRRRRALRRAAAGPARPQGKKQRVGAAP